MGRGVGVCLPALEAFLSGTGMLMLAYPGGDPYDSLYMGKAQPERVTF